MSTLEAVVVAALVCQLGSSSYAVREKAHQQLAKLGALPHLQLLAVEQSSNLELASRAKGLLNRYYSDNCDLVADMVAGRRPLPWMAELPSEWPEGVGQCYLQQARRQVGMHGPPEWKDYRLATWFMVKDMYRTRCPESDVRRILGLLADLEDDWIRYNGKRFDPPLTVDVKRRW